MKQDIKKAIQTTLVVDNSQSIDLCVDKIVNEIYKKLSNKFIQLQCKAGGEFRRELKVLIHENNDNYNKK